LVLVLLKNTDDAATSITLTLVLVVKLFRLESRSVLAGWNTWMLARDAKSTVVVAQSILYEAYPTKAIWLSLPPNYHVSNFFAWVLYILTNTTV
jgi:hypothetical protein